MSTQVPSPMFVDSLFLFTPYYDCIIVDYGCLSTVGNNGSECSIGQNTILCEPGDAFVLQSSNISTLDSGSSGDKSLTWFDFVVCVDNDGSVEHERMPSGAGTAEGSVGVS